MNKLIQIVISLLTITPILTAEENVQEIRTDENIARDKIIGRIIPKINEPIAYFSMLGDDEAKKWFRVDETSGDILTNSLLDREQICKSQRDYSCSIEFRVFLNTENANISSADLIVKVKIYITDLNDNLPSFEVPTKYLNITEASKIFSNFSLTQASDKDENRYGIIDYKLDDGNCENGLGFNQLSKGSINDYFQLIFDMKDPLSEDQIKPKLNQIKELDRETVSQFVGCLMAIDMEGNIAKQQIFIRIMDTNDNSPQWLNAPYNVTVNECQDYNNGLITSYYGRQLITKLDVTDADEGLYGEIALKIVDPGKDLPKLMIENSNLYAITKLDYETLPKFQVKIQAIDGDGLTNTTTVTVNVENCNDHSPSIQVIPRTKPISSMTEEEKSEISFTPDSEIWLLEENREPIQLAMIQIEDKDLMKDSMIECRLTRHGEKLSLVPTDITLMFSLIKKEGVLVDREKTQILHTDLICNDNEKPISRETTQRISIGVKDLNDNPPFWPVENFNNQIHNCEKIDKSISEKYKIFSISEKLDIGTCFGSWPARDIDIGKNSELNYSLQKSDLIDENIFDGSSDFTIDAHSGELCTKKMLDRESESIFSLKIRAVDNGIEPLLADTNIIICVTDINDNAPNFINEKNSDGFIEFNVDEGRGNRVIGKFKIEDKDFGKNGSWFLTLDQDSINPSDNNVHFGLSSSGDLMVTGQLDREKIPEYQMRVKAIDKAPSGSQLTSIASILVIVKDINDNIPKLIIDQTLNISVALEPGTLIHEVIAYDPDEGENAKVVFKLRIENPLADFFEIHSKNDGPDESGRSIAEIFLKRSLVDYYKNNRNINLESMKDYQAPFDRLILYVQANNVEESSSKVTTGKLLMNVFPESYQTQLPSLHSPHLNAGSEGKDSDYLQDESYSKFGSLTLLLVFAAIVVCIFLGVLATFAILYIKESHNRNNYEMPGDMNNLANGHNPGLLTIIQKDNEYGLRDEKLVSAQNANWPLQDDGNNKYTSLAAYTLDNGDVYLPTKTLVLKSPMPTHDFPSYTLQKTTSQRNRSIPYSSNTMTTPPNNDAYQRTLSKSSTDQLNWPNSHHQVRLVSPKSMIKNQAISPHSTLSSTECFENIRLSPSEIVLNQKSKTLNKYDLAEMIKTNDKRLMSNHEENNSTGTANSTDWSQNYTPLIENQLKNTKNSNSIQNQLNETVPNEQMITFNNSNSLSSFV